jgi:L-glutamine:2-deoxy-scyllo-inosose/3-amino-2,3-dideoxy-scyllo-inosose aminotransferase
MQLAIQGGNAVGLKKAPVWPIWSENTVNELKDVLDSGRWTISGQWKGKLSKCETFEQQYAAFNNCNYCLAFDHGTSSILAALQALNIGPGDEVIVPALTWVACIISICNVNAIPIVVDIDPDTYCISIDEIKKAITAKTKAIMPVHLYGRMADMDELSKIASEKKIHIIEDASHVHGSMWRDQYAGTIGSIGCFSFQQGKVLTSGEGGAALTNSASLYRKLQELRTNSRIYVEQDHCIVDQMQLLEKGLILGTNFCISEFQAAVLSDQLINLEKWNRIKQTQGNFLDGELSKIPGVTSMSSQSQVTRQSYYRYCIKIDNAFFCDVPLSKICQAIEAELGFAVEQPYKPLNKTILYHPETLKTYQWDCAYMKSICIKENRYPVAEHAAYNQGVIFHHSLLLNDFEDMERIVDAFAKVQKYAQELR